MAKKKTAKTAALSSDITLLLDRSGSMACVKDDMEGGMNRFVDDQKKVIGEVNFTLAQFDTEYEIVHNGIKVKDVPQLDLIPRGATALLDAVGRTIIATEERLAKLSDKEKPNIILMIIITDGHENSSHEFTKKQILDMIKTKQDKDKWQFTFLGANQDAIDEGSQIGVGVGQSMTYAQTKTGVANTFKNLSRSVCFCRSTGQNLSYSQKDRDESMED